MDIYAIDARGFLVRDRSVATLILGSTTSSSTTALHRSLGLTWNDMIEDSNMV